MARVTGRLPATRWPRPKPPKDPLLHYLELHEILRTELDRADLEHLALIGPNSANLFQRHIQMFEDKGFAPRMVKAFGELDAHVWRLRFDYYPASKRWPGYGITEGIERYLKPTLAAARRMGKRLSVTEAGAMYFNEHPCTSRTMRHDAFLTMAEGIVRCINEGVAGAMVWSFTSSGRIDGQWGWIGTRDQDFERVPNLYNGFACLMRNALREDRVGLAENAKRIMPMNATLIARVFFVLITVIAPVAPRKKEKKR